MITDQELFYEMLKTRKLILFGASGAAENLANRGFFEVSNVSYFCDNNEEKWNCEFMGIRVLPPSQLLNENKNDCIILITSSYTHEIEKTLKDYGFSNIFSHYTLYYTPKHLAQIQHITYENLDKIKQINDILSDTTSKEIFKKLIIKRLTKCSFYNDIKESGEYFIKDIFNFTENEVYVDAGAFNGDTIEEFINILNERYNKIYAFEPDELNFQKLNNTFINHNNIELLPFGLWSSERTLLFEANNSISSKISNEGKTKIKVVRLDDIVKEKVTFIKMDIEGAEFEAILGAKEIIYRDKPKLAICLYHKPEDLYEIPLKIKELVPEYKLYIRHHGGAMSETVLYATL